MRATKRRRVMREKPLVGVPTLGAVCGYKLLKNLLVARPRLRRRQSRKPPARHPMNEWYQGIRIDRLRRAL